MTGVAGTRRSAGRRVPARARRARAAAQSRHARAAAARGLRRAKADDGVRTRGPQLGKLMLYQLSYVRASGLYRRRLRVGDDDGRAEMHVVEDPLRVRDMHPDAAVRSR